MLVVLLQLIERALTAVTFGEPALEDREHLTALAVALEHGDALGVAGQHRPGEHDGAEEQRPHQDGPGRQHASEIGDVLVMAA